MRRSSLRCGARTMFATLVVSVGVVASSGPAGAANASHGKVDDALAAAAAGAAPSTPFRVIVYGDARAVKAAAAKGKVKLKKHLGVIDADSAVVSAGDLAQLAADAGITYIAPDLPVAPTADGQPVSFTVLANLYPQIDGAPSAWSQGYTGAGVGIAVIDSGVVARPDFGGRLTQVLLPGQTTNLDTYGHGTFVAGVAAGRGSDGRYVGIAPDASIFAVDVNDATGVYTSNIIAGLSWVDVNRAAYNIRVVNISLAETTATSYLSSPLDSAVEQLWRDGVVVVVSAGNLGPGTMQYAPANDPFAIAVGAVDSAGTLSAGDDKIATFSSSGTTADGFIKPDLLAPGRKVPSVLPSGTTLGAQAPLANVVDSGYATMSGTSFAAPQVAGAAALLLQQHPAWTPDQVKWALVQTGHSLAGSPGTTLDIAAAIGYAGIVGSANQGLAPAPPPGASTGTTATANTSSWNTSSWNTSSWNTSSWNFLTWD